MAIVQLQIELIVFIALIFIVIAWMVWTNFSLWRLRRKFKKFTNDNENWKKGGFKDWERSDTGRGFGVEEVERREPTTQSSAFNSTRDGELERERLLSISTSSRVEADESNLGKRRTKLGNLIRRRTRRS